MQDEWIKKADNFIAHTYKRIPLLITKGEGCWLWDGSGRRYLDFLSGIAVAPDDVIPFQHARGGR